jgi:signal peptidase II
VIKILLLIILFFCDIISKYFIFNLIELNTFIKVTFFFDLAHIHNFGISFGLFSNSFPPIVFVLIGILIIFMILIMLLKSKNNIEKWGYTLIIIGAISNIYDRFANGYVIDFIYLHFKDFYWPAFNFADIYISIGLFIIILGLIKSPRKKQN